MHIQTYSLTQTPEDQRVEEVSGRRADPPVRYRVLEGRWGAVYSGLHGGEFQPGLMSLCRAREELSLRGFIDGIKSHVGGAGGLGGGIDSLRHPWLLHALSRIDHATQTLA